MKSSTIPFNPETIRNRIYYIRGQQVMLDFDLAQIYGYSTKAFNQQVQRNMEKFEGDDFMFQLNESEIPEGLRSQFVTLNNKGNKRGLHIKYMPYVFTEQGIYMLMTVLRGELATKQSRMLIKLFKTMKDYIINNQSLISHDEALKLALSNKEDINVINKKISSMATKEDIKEIHNRLDIIDANFINEDNIKSFIIESNTKFELDEFYSRLFKSVNYSVIIIDNYLSIKTLDLLKSCKDSINIKLITNRNSNFKNKIKECEYNDFINEYPSFNTVLIDSNDKVHDRFIILDYKTPKQRIFSSGSSIKDSGNKISAIVELKDISLSNELIDLIENGKEYVW